MAAARSSRGVQPNGMKALLYFLLSLVLLAVLAAGGAVFAYYKYGSDLPDYRQLADYEPPVTTRLYAADGRLLAEYAREKRMFVPIGAIPKRVSEAFLAAEDKHFYEHFGVDPVSLVSAVFKNVGNVLNNRRLVGASTITQQIAKNFLLSNEVSYERKIKEAMLAFRIERAFSKERILELYLNQIYLGHGSYGVAAAALNYFNKSLDELSLSEAAFLAALPKAPNNYDPLRHPHAAKARRDWVLDQMAEAGFVSAAAAGAAKNEAIVLSRRDPTETVKADYFTEEVRRWLYDTYGEKRLYEGGLFVRTTLDPKLQEIADRVVREGLIAYDRRHGWRGPIARIPLEGDWAAALTALRPPAGLGDWTLAVVLKSGKRSAEIGFAGGTTGTIPVEELTWARAWQPDQKLGPAVKRADQVLEPGDVVAVERVPEAGEGVFALRQIPEVEGALVALDPHTGRILAMAGGFSYEESEFNRATQALRQPGSAFKPFVYLAALERGYSPADIVIDGPLAIDLGAGLGRWKPENYTQDFYGPTTLRVGIEKSRNLMTVRLAQEIGFDKVREVGMRFGVYNDAPRIPAIALGAGETTLLKLTAAYSMLVNGGKRIEPALIERIQDREGRTIYRRDDRPCAGCQDAGWNGGAPPKLPDTREAVVDPRSAYQIVSMLEGVVERGTGRKVAEVGKPLAGKTGTTNESMDSWFVGFSPDLAVGVFVGFDRPRTLGEKETGASVASPIFRDFMAAALAGEPTVPFRVPPGIVFVRVDEMTGRPAESGSRNVVLEAFKIGQEPSAGSERLWTGGPEPSIGSPQMPAGTGGLY